MANNILAIDPSGAFIEGSGTTGWVLMDENYKVIDKGSIRAANFQQAEAYWQAHNILIASFYKQLDGDLQIVLEEFMLYRNKALDLVNSKLETVRLLGAILTFCYESEISVHMQRAVDVKKRWSNEVMVDEGLIENDGLRFKLPDSDIKLNLHELDALRHAVHYVRYKKRPIKAAASIERLTAFCNYEDRPWEGGGSDDK